MDLLSPSPTRETDLAEPAAQTAPTRAAMGEDAASAAPQSADLGAPAPMGDELSDALARFAAALTKVERAAARAAGRDDAVRVQAMAINRLKRENEQLRSAQEEEARLRDATLAQVDRAMEAVERALQTAAAPSPSTVGWSGDDAYGNAA